LFFDCGGRACPSLQVETKQQPQTTQNTPVGADVLDRPLQVATKQQPNGMKQKYQIFLKV